MTNAKQDLKDILEHIKIVIYKVWDANKERLRLETYALGIIEDIEGAIEQRFGELEKRLEQEQQRKIEEHAKTLKEEYPEDAWESWMLLRE